MKKTKKIKETTARILFILLIAGAGYTLITGLFIRPISEFFSDRPVTTSNVMVVIIGYLIIAVIMWLLVTVWNWVMKNI